MKKYTLKADLMVPGLETEAGPISVLRYNAGVSSAKNRITLQQHLFSFLLEGEKTVYYAGTTLKIDPGQFLLLAAGNCMMSEKTTAESGSYRSILLFFDAKVLSGFFTAYPGLSKAVPAAANEEPILVFNKDRFLQHFIESLDHMLADGGQISANMRQVKLYELLLYLGEHYPGQLQKLRSISSEADDELLIRQAVTANLDQPVTVEELAFLCNTSLSTFKRRFARIYGTSPNRWLLEKRMQKAAQLLKQGDYKASEIYYQIGYENLSSFIQSFKQVYGVTPKQYQLSE